MGLFGFISPVVLFDMALLAVFPFLSVTFFPMMLVMMSPVLHVKFLGLVEGMALATDQSEGRERGRKSEQAQGFHAPLSYACPPSFATGKVALSSPDSG